MHEKNKEVWGDGILELLTAEGGVSAEEAPVVPVAPQVTVEDAAGTRFVSGGRFSSNYQSFMSESLALGTNVIRYSR